MSKAVAGRNPSTARIVSIGTANPEGVYDQGDLVRLFGVDNPKIARLFGNSHIQKRHLTLPEPVDGLMPEESAEQLLAKHKSQAVELGRAAAKKALDDAGLTPADVAYLSVVTSTGFLCPGLTAFLIEDMGFARNVHRIDIVGMGCNGGLNGLQPVVNYCAADEGRVGLLICIEVCSAAYVFDDTLRTAVVNSLFGDGAAAAVVRSGGDGGLAIHDFESEIIVDEIGAMRFDFEGGKNSFYLSRNIPYVIGSNCERPIKALLTRNDVRQRDVKHWVIHSGGRKVIDAIKYTLDLTAHDLRHTEGVLQNFGNLSSASFLFSLQRLMEEGVASGGDRTVLMAMGPGATIETCLASF